jgi:hypothetical protein
MKDVDARTIKAIQDKEIKKLILVVDLAKGNNIFCTSMPCI